jgi:1,2-diacylglycerol 3-beta-galactosyltransferase
MAPFRVSLLLALTAHLQWTQAFSVKPPRTRLRLQSVRLAASTPTAEDVCTIQILMSDTGGGHRASANALRDAFDILHPGKFQVDIVDIYTDYGPFWPYNDYVAMYKLMAAYSFLWEGFYYFGASDFGLCLNEILLETFCFDAFKECLNRPSGTTSKRADMVVSVHPLCQDLPLKILADLDSNGKTRAPQARTTPFCTVVTDLGGAHPTWFNKKYVLQYACTRHVYFLVCC